MYTDEFIPPRVCAPKWEVFVGITTVARVFAAPKLDAFVGSGRAESLRVRETTVSAMWLGLRVEG